MGVPRGFSITDALGHALVEYARDLFHNRNA